MLNNCILYVKKNRIILIFSKLIQQVTFFECVWIHKIGLYLHHVFKQKKYPVASVCFGRHYFLVGDAVSVDISRLSAETSANDEQHQRFVSFGLSKGTDLLLRELDTDWFIKERKIFNLSWFEFLKLYPVRLFYFSCLITSTPQTIPLPDILSSYLFSTQYAEF